MAITRERAVLEPFVTDPDAPVFARYYQRIGITVHDADACAVRSPRRTFLVSDAG
jgi:hypothetical protein